MLNVNMDKHPHRINERRMGILKGGGGLAVSRSFRIAPFNS